MPIDASIPLSIKPLEIPNQLSNLAQFSQIQNAQNANALTQYKIDQAQREEASNSLLNEAYRRAYDPNTGKVNPSVLSQTLATGGFGSKIPEVQKGLMEQQLAQSKLQKEQSDLVDAKLKQSRQFLETIDPNDPNAPKKYLEWHQANHADPVLGPTLAARGITPEQSLSSIQQALQTPGGFPQLLNQSKLGIEKFMELNKPHFVNQDQGGFNQIVQVPGMGGRATVVPGSVTPKSMAPGEAIRVGLEGRRVGLSELANEQAINPDLQAKLAAAKVAGQNIAKNQVAASQALPAIIDTARQTLSEIDNLIGDAQVQNGKVVIPKGGRAPHPGFEGAVGAGLGMKYIQGTPERDFQTRVDQILGGAFLQAYETLRASGQISDKEGAKGTAAYNRMTTTSSEVEFINATREFQDVVRKGVERAKIKASGNAIPGGMETPVTNMPSIVGPKPLYATNGKSRIVSNDGGNTWQPVGGQ